MVSTLVLSRLPGRPSGSVGRVGAVTARNLVALRRSGFWLVVVSGLVEPMLYLFAMGIGVGGLIRSFTLADGTVVSYAAFVAPGMLAAAAMNAALAESTYNFFARLRWAKLYDAMVATPLRPMEIALGELGWSLMRGTLYGMVFLAIMVGLDLTTPLWAVAALIASPLVGLAFGCIGMTIATLIRTWQDFDYLAVIQFALFLFSATFAPLSTYPVPMQIAVEIMPLYHGVELARALTMGRPDWATVGHVAYLLALAAVGLTVASRRMNRLLCR